MSFLMIQNPGVAPVEGYTLLGVSTTRDANVVGTVGQFGSGAKHAINVLLRAGLRLLICCGRTRLEFTTRDEVIDDGLVQKTVQRVICKLSGTSSRVIDCGWVLDFGAIDWRDTAMAVREFVANAIDRTIRESGDFRPALATGDLTVCMGSGAPRIRDGFTRVFIEINPDIQRYYGELPRRFLHFSSDPDQVFQSLLPKADRNLGSKRTAMIYKSGVFVRAGSSYEPESLYDYNFQGDQLRLNESRDSSDYEVKAAAARTFIEATKEQLIPILESLLAGEATYEATFDPWYLTPYSNPDEEQRKTWCAAWAAVCGENTVLCTDESAPLAETLVRKGYRVERIKSASWAEALGTCGVTKPSNILDKHEGAGRIVIPPTDAAIKAVDQVWEWLRTFNMTGGKTKPPVKCYHDIMRAEATVLGYYSDGTVYVKSDVASHMSKVLLCVTLEEVAHYVTGATDNSRDFQNFAFQLITEMAV